MALTAVVAGVGPGLGESLARKFAGEGCEVGLLARSDEYLGELAAELHTETPGDAVAVPTDVTDGSQVESAFERVRDEFGPVDVLVNHAGGGGWSGLRESSAEEFEDAWRTCAYGAFLCSKQAVPDMVDGDGGTVVFTGATSAVRGRGDAAGFSSGKFAARGLAESMARELGPEGVHVAHVVVDGQILPPDAREGGDDRPEDSSLDPDAVAESYWDLVEQDRTAWTLELDLRPYVEEF
ncbi:short-chain dehydrogenase [Halobacteriales archaeon QS_9_68_17]|nr:MAG: short-chain dehydrogenase [Halobacteriales archaeon QS_9_68_17]